MHASLKVIGEMVTKLEKLKRVIARVYSTWPTIDFWIDSMSLPRYYPMSVHSFSWSPNSGYIIICQMQLL